MAAESVVGTEEAKPYPLSTRTGIEDIDEVLAAVENEDPQKLRDLIHFTTIACTKADGLGGPPKCRENEPEGTLVDVLPFLGPEGHFLRRGDVSSFSGVNVTGLYAIYKVSDSAYSEAAYPAGEYAIVFKGKENQPDVIIHVQDGVIRIDYLYPPTAAGGINKSDVSEMIIAP